MNWLERYFVARWLLAARPYDDADAVGWLEGTAFGLPGSRTSPLGRRLFQAATLIKQARRGVSIPYSAPLEEKN